MAERPEPTTRERFSSGLLSLYLYYRFLLALALLGLHAWGVNPVMFGGVEPGLYFSVSVAYVTIAAITLGFYQLQRHHLSSPQLFFSLLADIVAQTLLMYASGGLSSGIGYLLLVTVAAGSIFFAGQLAVVIPAVASICIILESAVGVILLGRSDNSVFPAGLLGVLLFITALIFGRLSRALVQAERQAATESELSAELQQLNQLIINRMLTGILVVDDEGTVEQLNSAATELLGHAPNQRPLRRGDSIRGETRLMERLREWRHAPWTRAGPFIPRFGDTELQANFARLEQAGKDRTIVFLEDFRAATQQAQQLKLASLGRLTGSIAHEIRNPLGAISHASELLSESNSDNPANARLTAIIQGQVGRMNHIVNNVLQLSRRQQHKPRAIDLASWLDDFLEHYRQGWHREPKIELRLDETGQPITFDPVQLQQVLTNLLDNALRYSEEATGEPWAAIRSSLSTDGQTTTLDVLDRGHGVAEEHRGKLFEPFFTTSSGGSGLGLYIARELCAINYATLKYQAPYGDEPGFFRISFVHPEKILNRPEMHHVSEQGTDH